MKKSINRIQIVSLLFVIVLLSLCMFGCKGKDDKRGKEKDTVVSEEQDKEEDTNALPKEKQMAKDIDSFGANAIAMSSGTYTLKTSSIEITKAKEDAEQYVVYCTAAQESDMFKASNSYKMTYNFYDIGGWVLDECVIEKIDMIPKTTIAEEEARCYASGLNNFTSLTHINTEKVSETQYIFHYVGKYEYNYMDDVYNNDVVCTYDNSYGWYISYVPKGSYHDWSKMLGTWYGEYESNVHKTTVNIKEVNEATGTIKFDVQVTGMGNQSYLRQDLYKTDVVATFEYTDKTHLLEQGKDYWTEIKSSGKQDFFEIYWGKDKGAWSTRYGTGRWVTMTKIK